MRRMLVRHRNRRGTRHGSFGSQRYCWPVPELRSLHRSGGFLGRLDADDRAALLKLGHVRRYRQGAPILFQGDHSDTVFVILQGRVKITHVTAEGHETVFSVLGPGDMLGDFEAIDDDGGPRTAGGVALEAIECRVFTAQEFRSYLDSHPRATVMLLRVIINRLHAADRRRIGSGSLDTSHRLARFLVELIDQRGQADTSGIDIDIPLTQEEVASLIATSRQSVVRALTSLRSRGLVTTARRKLIVRDLDGLRRYAE
jgi:CRP/FNR family transcriptional regulator, cyclic AMP receptor protein